MNTTSNLVAEVRNRLAAAGLPGEIVADDQDFTVAKLETLADRTGTPLSHIIATAEATA